MHVASGHCTLQGIQYINTCWNKGGICTDIQWEHAAGITFNIDWKEI